MQLKHGEKSIQTWEPGTDTGTSRQSQEKGQRVGFAQVKYGVRFRLTNGEADREADCLVGAYSRRRGDPMQIIHAIG